MVGAIVTVGIIAAIWNWSVGQDFVHLWWAVQIPLVSTFLLSGNFAARGWAHEHRPATTAEQMQAPGVFFVATLVLAVTPLVVEETWPIDHTQRRVTESPTIAILQFVGWSFGGPRPDCLRYDMLRGIGHVSRDVTVPMGILLIAAWTSIVFSASTLALRLIRNANCRLAASFVVAPIFGTVVLIMKDPVGIFDPGLFPPYADDRSAVWNSDPLTLRTFGFVVLAGVLCSVALLVTLQRARRSGSAVVPRPSSG